MGIRGMVAGATAQTEESMQAIQGNVTNVTDWAACLMKAVWDDGIHVETSLSKFPWLGAVVNDITLRRKTEKKE